MSREITQILRRMVHPFFDHLHEKKENEIHELECRLFSFTDDGKKQYSIDRVTFDHMVKHFIFPVDVGGLGYQYDISIYLNIVDQQSRDRYTIEGLDNIKHFWLTNDFTRAKAIHKERLEQDTNEEYGVRCALNRESTITNASSRSSYLRVQSGTDEKLYRYMKRYRIRHPSHPFFIDLSCVRSATGTTYRSSSIFTAPFTYECELEITNEATTSPNEAAYLELLEHMLRVQQRSNTLISKTQIGTILHEYNELTGTVSRFIAANPVTMHREHLNDIGKPYAITLKADGERCFIYIAQDGDIVRINNRFTVRAIGHRLSAEYAGTLFEGEYMEMSDKTLLYDCLFWKGRDMRPASLLAKKVDRERGSLSRHGVIQDFLTRNEIPSLQMKPFEYSTSQEQFHHKTKLMWSNRLAQGFEVDGIIFTPIDAAYPGRPGVWRDLWKWKPSELNTIDFLVKIEKDTIGQDKIGYVVVNSQRIAFKTAFLHVGSIGRGSSNVPNGSRLFAPERGETHYRAPIALSSHMRMIITDPVHQIVEELHDDTIVEFAYDQHDSNFPWKPIRNRHDKTDAYKRGEPVYGNVEHVANDIWMNIRRPVESHMLFEGHITDSEIATDSAISPQEDARQSMAAASTPIVQLHQQLFGTFAADGQQQRRHLAAIGARPEDVSVWHQIGYPFMVGFASNQEYVQTAISRWQSIDSPKGRMFFIWSDFTSSTLFPAYTIAQDDRAKERLQELIPAKYGFQVVTVTHGIYFEKDFEMEAFMLNVADLLDIDGQLGMILLNGQRIFSLLAGARRRQHEDIEIEKLYTMSEWTPTQSNIGKRIRIKENDMTREEYLVNIEYLIEQFVQAGFELIQQQPLTETSLYDQVILKKSGPTPDRLYRDFFRKEKSRMKRASKNRASTAAAETAEES